MLSRVALRSAAAPRAAALTVVPVRTEMAQARHVPTADHIKNWKEAGELFNSEERDKVNFPDIKMAETIPPVRFGCISENYFKFFFEKTGATGAYVFPVALSVALLSKEIVVLEHNLFEVPIFLYALYWIGKKFGDKIGAKVNACGEERMQRNFLQPVADTKKVAADFIADGEQYLEQLTGKQHMYETFRENVDLQLEEDYRKRLAEVHQAVLQRLNYQAAVETTKRQFEHEHMTKWIIDGAVAGITPQQEKESISKCIGDLKALAAKA